MTKLQQAFSDGGSSSDVPNVLKWQMNHVAKDVKQANWMADTITGMTRKVVDGYADGEAATRGFLVLESMMSAAQVGSALYIMQMQRAEMKLAASIREFHRDQTLLLEYADANQRKLLTEGTDAKAMAKVHLDVMEANATLRADTAAAAQEEYDRLNALTDAAENAYHDAVAAKQAHNDAYMDVQEALNQNRGALAEARAELALLDPDSAEGRAKLAIIAGLEDQISADQAKRAALDAAEPGINDNINLKLEEKADAQGKLLSQSIVLGNALEGIGDMADVRASNNDFAYDDSNPNKWANSGMMDNGISAVRIAMGLGAVATAGNASDEVLAALGLGATTDAFYGLASATQHTGAADLFGETTAGKLGAAFTGMAATAGIASAGLMMSEIAKQLDNPDLSDQERTYLQAELALQGTVMALSGIDGVLTSMVTTGAMTSAYALKAIPILGGFASIASAINPARWAEFDAIEERIDGLDSEGSATEAALGDALNDTLHAKKAFYGSTAALDMAFGIGASAMAATGVGAPLAIATAVVGAVISGIVRATEQARLEGIADDLRADMTADGRTVEEFFDLSFDDRQDELRENYADYFDKMLDEDFDAAIGLGSQVLTANDLSTAAISKTGGELRKTAKHYADTYTTAGGWDPEEIMLSEQEGSDTLTLADRGSEKVYLTFMSPLLASGNESTSREETGKNEFRTSLTIEDMAGWKIVDSGAETNTTFNMVNVINHARDINGNDITLDMEINAGGGDDTYFGYDSAITFNGGKGTDTVSYTRMGDELLTKGISAKATGDEILVDKTLRADSKVYTEVVGEFEEAHGKRTETIEYRSIELKERGEVTTVQDKLMYVERFHGTSLDDVLDMSGSTIVDQIFGFGGDDRIMLAESTSVTLGGEGDDHIYVGEALTGALSKMADGSAVVTDAVYIDGGADLDRVYFDEATHDALRGQYAEQQLASAYSILLSRMLGVGADADVIAASLESYMMQGTGDDFGLAVFNDVEFLHFDLGTFEVPYEDMSSTVMTVHTYSDVNLQTSQFVDWANDHDADTIDEFEGALIGDNDPYMLKEYQGKIYLQAGETYEFRETVDDKAVLYIDDERIIRDYASHQSATGTFTADEAGWYDYSFYAYNHAGDDRTELEVRNVSTGTQFEHIVGDVRLEQLLGFESRMLNGNLTGDATLDTIWHAADFQAMIDDVLTPPSGLNFLTRNGLVETYENTSFTNISDFSDYAGSRAADSVERATSVIDDFVADDTLHHYSGEIWLEAGESYEFRETNDDWTLFTINDELVLGNHSAHVHTTGTYEAEVSGWYSYDFYSYNYTGPGLARLEIKSGGMDDFILFDGEMVMGTELSAAGMFSSVTLVGDDMSNSLIGSEVSDTIFGSGGHDIIEGGGGSDVLSGGAGFDTFVRDHWYVSHDIIVEMDAQDWVGNTFKFTGTDLNGIRFAMEGDDLVIVTSNLKSSITLKDFYKEDGSGVLKTQYVEDKDGDVFVFDQSFLGNVSLDEIDYTLNHRDNIHGNLERVQNALDALDNLQDLSDDTFQDAFVDLVQEQFDL
ncbi:hypothetical protein ACJ5NV_19180 [Loktanella agnita]